MMTPPYEALPLQKDSYLKNKHIHIEKQPIGKPRLGV